MAENWDVTIAEPLRKLTERSQESRKNTIPSTSPILSLAELWTGFEMGDLVALKTEDHRFDRFAIRMQPPFASHPRFRDDVCAAKVQGGKSILPSIAGLGLLSKSAQSSSGLREFRSTSRPYSVMVLRELLGRSGWLSLIQIADHALPLVTFPFVTRALGIEYFGDYAIVVGICSYFALLTIASAYVTGPKIVAEVKNDKRKLDLSVSQIVFFQLVTFVVVSLLFIPAFMLVPMLLKHPAVSILVFLQLNAVALAPTWFFLGMERTKLLGISQLLVRSAGVGAILVLVRTPSDLITYAIINLAVALTSLALLFAMLLRSGIRFSYPGPRALRASASSNAGIMLSEFCMILYSGAGVVIVGALLGSAAAGAFAFVDRILVAARGLFVPVYSSAFPVLCRYSASEPEKAPKLRRILLLLLLVTGFALSCALLALAGDLALLFGGREFASIEIFLRLVWLVPLLSVCSSFFGMLSLVVFGFVTQFSQVRILGSLLGVACLYVGTVLAGLEGVFVAVLIVETLSAAGFIAALIIKKSFLRAIGRQR